MTTERNIVEALIFACSQDPAVLKVGENYLKEWESQSGFYTILAVSDLHHVTRFHACIALELNSPFVRRKFWQTVRWMYRFDGWPLRTLRTESIAIGVPELQCMYKSILILFAGKPWVYVCGVITTALSVTMKRPLCEEPFWIVWKNLSSR